MTGPHLLPPSLCRALALCALLGLAVVGCSTPAIRPAGQAPQPPAAESPTNGPTSASPSSNPLPSTGSGLRITFDGVSEARYHAQEVLARTRLPNQAVGRTNQVTGAIVIDGSGQLVPAESKVTVDLRQLTSDERLRDRFIRDDTLQTGRFPNAEFAASEARGLPWPAPTSGEVKFQLLGDLTVHGVKRPAVWDVVANVSGLDVAATAATKVKITDFGMQIPRVASVLSLEDELTLDLETKTKRS